MTNNKRKIDSEDVTRLHAQGLTAERIAAMLRTDIETVEYLLDRAWAHWASAYGYDN